MNSSPICISRLPARGDTCKKARQPFGKRTGPLIAELNEPPAA